MPTRHHRAVRYNWESTSIDVTKDIWVVVVVVVVGG